MAIENRFEERKELESRALLCLEHGEDLEPTEVVRQLRTAFRLWHYPSFGEYKSWLLFLPLAHVKDSEYTFAREVTWKRTDDVTRLTDPMIGLSVQDKK